MRYGFVIDQDRCIGCHACTVACKEEHQVPVGVFRTWVKYVEKGEFPHTSRHFGVMRCNHCDSAPCIDICPTHALYRRSDGIVDFDNQRCIGCKSCMQACPYDALYIDPNTNTAAKCNFCAHRVENNLEPACVIVCPTQAIIAGDLDDSGSSVSRIVATQKVSVRKPEKGTEPKLYYKGIEPDLLQPTRLSRSNTYAFAEQRDQRPVQQGFDPTVTREIYDVSHPTPWGWKIAAYLWTKSIAAGVLMVAALFTVVYGDVRGEAAVFRIASPLIALIGLAVTMALLVFDLKRPDRFYYLLLKPNFRSWLVLGAYILMGYGACAVAWLWMGLFRKTVPAPLVEVSAVFAVAAACYSAFLFAQAKGRELWRSSVFFCWHLLVQALVAGAAVIIILEQMIGKLEWSDVIMHGPPDAVSIMGVALLLNLITLLVEVLMPRKNEEKRLAIQSLTRGRFALRFWISVVFLGVVCPIVVPELPLPEFTQSIAAVLALYGLWWFEQLWVKAGQAVPLS